MPNMPSITPIEIAVVGGGIVLLYLIPFVLALIDQRRRRREQSWQAIVGDFNAATPVVPEQAQLPLISYPAEGEAPTAPTATQPDEIESAPVAAVADEHPPVIGSAADAPLSPPEPVVSPPAEPPAPDPLPATAESTAPEGNGAREHSFEPFEGDGGYSFRLEDLHRVRLVDITVPDAERMLGAQRSALTSTVLVSPYPVQSACLAAAERSAASLRLCYLLFPSLWPASRDEAVAEAVFEIDTAAGTITHQLGVRSAADLDDSARRAIRENGGHI